MTNWVEFFKSSERSIYSQCIGNRMLIELITENTPKGGRVLEAGCGTALLSLILADYGYNVTAVDYTKEVVDYAQAKAGSNSLNIKFQQGDILQLTSLFDGKYFDTICHSGVMEHFNDKDIIASLSEQRKVSRRVIFNIPNNRNKLLPAHFGDERFLCNKKWLSLIKEAGFNNSKVYGGYDLPRPFYLFLPGVFFRRKADFWWKWFSKHSIFICE
jgi:SAM-dependent methyltransferase